GSITAAEAAFREAIAVDPGLPAARGGLAEISRRRGDYAAALEHIDAGLADPRIDPRNRDNLTKQRAALVLERDRAASLEAVTAGGAASTAETVALATLEADRGRFDRAVELLAASSPQGPDRERLAYFLFRAGRFREAHEIYAELARAGGRADLEV